MRKAKPKVTITLTFTGNQTQVIKVLRAISKVTA
jgi:hypothetical protein